MTVNQAIMRADKLKPNMYSVQDKVEWLNQLDALLYQDVILQHEHDPELPETFAQYDPDESLDAQLIAPHPYDMIYIYWLQSQIDLNNAEFAKYNTSSALYNQAYSEFAGYYNRTHRPLSHIRAIVI